MIGLKSGVGKCNSVYTAIYEYILVYTEYCFWFLQLGINKYILILDNLKGICDAMHGTGLSWYWDIIKLYKQCHDDT